MRLRRPRFARPSGERGAQRGRCSIGGAASRSLGRSSKPNAPLEIAKSYGPGCGGRLPPGRGRTGGRSLKVGRPLPPLGRAMSDCTPRSWSPRRLRRRLRPPSIGYSSLELADERSTATMGAWPSRSAWREEGTTIAPFAPISVPLPKAINPCKEAEILLRVRGSSSFLGAKMRSSALLADTSTAATRVWPSSTIRGVGVPGGPRWRSWSLPADPETG
jgi:hypothetical protein